jgi:hypothetical protein
MTSFVNGRGGRKIRELQDISNPHRRFLTDGQPVGMADGAKN